MKSWMVHYKNKYPGGRVILSEGSLDVYDVDGAHCVALRRDGHGNLVDRSQEFGCEDSHDLAPIPKQARLWKVCPKSGHVIKDEEHEERSSFMEKQGQALVVEGRVKSIDEHGKKFFDDRGNLESK